MVEYNTFVHPLRGGVGTVLTKVRGTYTTTFLSPVA